MILSNRADAGLCLASLLARYIHRGPVNEIHKIQVIPREKFVIVGLLKRPVIFQIAHGFLQHAGSV